MQFRTKCALWLLLLLNYTIVAHNTKVLAEQTEQPQTQQVDANQTILLTAKVYAKLFRERRMAQQIMTKQLLKSNYEKTFKLLKLAYEKIFEVVNTQNTTLNTHAYQPARDGFPATAVLQDAVVLTLESCCVAAENVLHFPEMSYRIFRQLSNSHWKPTLNWCIDFVQSLPDVIEESTVKLMELLQMEVNEELRTPNYVNPYYKPSNTNEPKKQQKKPPKKLKKGPQLSGGRNEL